MDDLFRALNEVETESLETTSESQGGSDDSGYAYESEARLMDEKQVLEICGILDIPRWAVNNYKSMPPPDSVGAGRVRAFRGNEKREFLARPEASQEYVDEMSSATARLMDPSSPLSMNLNEGHPWENWPPISTCDNFQIPVNEIRKRAAWAWYRTGMLCELAARQSGLGDAAKGEGLASVERSPMSISLSLKSERAKSHALSLFPDLLHEERVECPSWAEPFTADDERYYMELNRNQEYVMRVVMAEIYKRSAIDYMFEAISPYLEQRQERELEETPGDPLEIHEYADETVKTGKYGCLSRLWWENIQWYEAGPGSSIEPHDRGWSSDLQPWWVRAAQARGHAEWLIKERRDAQTFGHTQAIESWRLLPPGTVDHYDNSCVVWAIWSAVCRNHGVNGWDDFDEDDFLTHFNILSDVAHGRQSMSTGWPLRSYLYGAPEFVFHDLAKNGPNASLIGLLPTDTTSRCHPQVRTCIGVYDRYMRRGVQDTLDESVADHLRTLARCADDILAEYHAEATLGNLQKAEYIESGILPSLVSALQKMLSKRVHMTLQDAEDCNFDEVVYQCIKFYLDEAMHMLRWQHQAGVHEVLYLMYVERELSKLLAPWFDFRLRAIQRGQIFIQLRSLLTQREVEKFRPGTGLTSQPVWKMHEDSVLITLHSFLEEIRTEILQGRLLPPETHDFIAPFMSYLNSGGNLDLMPVIKGGDMKTERRELTKLGFFSAETSRVLLELGFFGEGFSLSCDCPMHSLIQDMEETLQGRTSADELAQTVQDSELLTPFFELDNLLEDSNI